MLIYRAVRYTVVTPISLFERACVYFGKLVCSFLFIIGIWAFFHYIVGVR